MNILIKPDITVRQILIAGYIKPGGVTKHHQNRPCHGLVINCENKNAFHFNNGTTLHVLPHDVLFLPKGSNYTVQNVGDNPCYVIDFTVEDDEDFEPFVLHPKDYKSLLDIFRCAEQTWLSQKAGYKLMVRSLLYNLLYKLQKEIQHGYMDKAKHDLIRPAVKYIHENYSGEQLQITQLADLCGISPEYFRSIFRCLYGVSPIKYINRLKMKRAADLLSSGLYSVTEAASLSGYSDLSYFSREFKKHYGVSPTDYQ